MTESPFDLEGGLLIVDAWIEGPLGRAPLRLAVDTAATLTLITPEVIERISYSARDGTLCASARLRSVPMSSAHCCDFL